MKRRWLKLLVVFAGLGLAGFLLYLWLGPSGGINRMSVLRIKVGMSHEEVNAVIGLPHGDYSTDNSHPIIGLHKRGGEVRFWYGDNGAITVWIDDDGKVSTRDFSPASTSLFDKFYRWIGIDG